MWALQVFGACVRAYYDSTGAFLHEVVVHREDVVVRNWRTWFWRIFRFIPVVRLSLTWWLLPLFLNCDRGLTDDGCGFSLILIGLMSNFERLGFPSSVGRAGSVDFSAFNAEVGGWLPFLGEVDFPPLSGLEPYDTVQHKKPSAGSLDGWGWRDLKDLPVSWFDWLAEILSRVELDGVWPDGLLDADIAMIPKADGDAASTGQRPWCVLPVVHRLWAYAGLQHLEGWLKSWLSSSVFSAG